MGKQNIYDHSVHVPLILSGKGIPKGEKRSQLCYIYDIYPTLCELSGIAIPETVQLKSLVPSLKDAEKNHRDHLSFAFMSWQRSVYDGRHKLIEYCVDGKRTTQLFDLKDDPQETKNLAGDPGSKPMLVRLRKLLIEEKGRLNDGNTPYPFSDKLGDDFWETYASAESGE
jgi:arylsulfatase A-like enzyme